MSYTDEAKANEETSRDIAIKREGEIPHQMAELTGQIEMIEGAVARLETTIAPICNDLVLTDGGQKEKESGMKSPVGQVLSDLTKRANGIVEAIDSLGERVEL